MEAVPDDDGGRPMTSSRTGGCGSGHALTFLQVLVIPDSFVLFVECAVCFIALAQLKNSSD